MEGEGLSKTELRRLGEELIGRVTQQYVYHRIITEMKNRNMAIVDEEVAEDRTVRIRVRNLGAVRKARIGNMANEEFEIEISPSGKVTVRTIGIKGPHCLDYADLFAQILGREESRELTAEYYEESTDIRQRIDIRHRH